MARITIVRDKGWADRARKYKIFANSQCVGKIANGETQSFELDPGHYEVYLKIDWCRSNKIPLHITTEPVTLQGGSSLRGWRLWLAFVYILFLPHRYLWLKQQAGEQSAS